jgi:hypothetical protein
MMHLRLVQPLLFQVSEEFCPDGLVFDETSSSYAKCGFPFSVECTGRDERQPVNPTPGCPHQHGYFAVPDETTAISSIFVWMVCQIQSHAQVG